MLSLFRKSIWRDENDNTVILSRRCLNKLMRFAREYSPRECGSWLLGIYPTAKTCVISDIANVPSDSTHECMSFCRGVEGFDRVGDNYVGEWHTHPGGTCNPSGTDDATMEQLRECRLRGCASPIMIILSGDMRGIDDVCVYVYRRDGKRVQLTRKRRLKWLKLLRS